MRPDASSRRTQGPQSGLVGMVQRKGLGTLQCVFGEEMIEAAVDVLMDSGFIY